MISYVKRNIVQLISQLIITTFINSYKSIPQVDDSFGLEVIFWIGPIDTSSNSFDPNPFSYYSY